jgi:pimeloyl-ACP methyl ester carboxylesterase
MSLTEEPIEYNVTHFNAIPKVYLYTAKDPVITLSTQTRYTERTKITDTDSLATGHFPMLSDPTTLAALLQKWAKN